MLKQFGALPSEKRAREMKDRDFLWCLANELLDGEEELDRMCPACRERALENRCPVCGAPAGQGAVNTSFDLERFLAMKEGRQT